MSADTRNLLINCHSDSKQKWHEPIIIVPSHGRFRLNAKILPLSDSLAPSVEVKYLCFKRRTPHSEMVYICLVSTLFLKTKMIEVISSWHLTVPDEFSELGAYWKVCFLLFLVRQYAVHISVIPLWWARCWLKVCQSTFQIEIEY